MLAGVDHAPDADVVPLPEAGDLSSDADNATDNFMTRYDRIDASAPVIADLMQVRVAYTTIQDFNYHIVRSSVTAFKTI
jgi:hypothetical protein